MRSANEPRIRVPQSARSFYAMAGVSILLTLTTTLHAQKKNNKSGYDNASKATVLHTANVYVSADSSAPPIITVTPGHEIVLLDPKAPATDKWLNIFANTDAKEDADPDSKPEFEDPKDNPDPSSGWIRNKGVVGPNTPNGDALIFESQAMQPHGPKGSAEAAHLLYRRVAEYFPQSPLAAEAAFRSADIRWQLDKTDISTLPSAHEQEAYLRPQLYEGELKRVVKLYPQSSFAARAAFDLLDNRLCGDWQGLPKCPEMETTLYLRYADQYPDSPKAAESLYNAAYRQGVLVTMYLVDENPKLSAQAAKACQSIADELKQKYPGSDYTARAASIAFRVRQGIPIYGSDRD